jgi:hypothetical protein
MVMLPSIVITQLLKYSPQRAQWPPHLLSVTSIVFVKAKYRVAQYVKEVGTIFFRNMPRIAHD